MTDLFDGPFGAAYAWYMGHERVSRAIAAIVWGADVRPFYASMAAVAEVRAGGTIVDAPCGAGAAFRGLRPGADVRYLALDRSPGMLDRARRVAPPQAELVEGDATAVPLEDGAADLFLSYFGLHCFPEPAAAVREAARCLRPGGRLVGSMICRVPTVRARLLVRPHTGAFGPTGTPADLARWLADAGLDAPAPDVRGPFAYFTARRGG